MCNDCDKFVHQQEDQMYREIFGHHPMCEKLTVEILRRARLGRSLERYIDGKVNRTVRDRLAAQQSHETRRHNDCKPAKDRPVREHDIQEVLFKNLYWQKKHRWIAPNVDIFTTGEMDLCSVTPAGMIHEYEIKLSRSDFLADRRKEHKHPQLKRLACGETFIVSEPVYYRSGPTVHHIKGPNYYSYVIPRDMVSVAEVPDYSGLIYIDLEKLWSFSSAFDFVKKPKALHKTRADTNFKLSIGEKLMYRCWTAREKLTKQYAIEQAEVDLSE